MTPIKTIAISVAGTLTAAAAIGLWNVGGFVTHEAYAEDQGKLDQIIHLLTYKQERTALVEKINDLRGEVADAKAYLDATPRDSEIYAARQSRHGRLDKDLGDAQTDLENMDKMRQANP